MKKRSALPVLTILCLALAVLTAIGLGACVKDEPTNAGPFTESVSSAADMEKLRSHLGAYYDQGVFELTNDIFIDGDWAPIGTSVTESFRGTLDGKGHTITYTIDTETPDKTDTSALATSASYGLFGYLAGATVKNLNLVVNVKVPVEAEILYAGGLAGFIYGDAFIENVTVSGSVTVSVSNILNESIADIYASEMNASIGGVFGYAIGDVTLKNVSSSADVTAAAYRLLGTATLDTVQIGGVGGTLRTEDISTISAAGQKLENVSHVSVNNVSSSGRVEAWGASVNAGGIFGLTHRTLAEKVYFTGTVSAYFVSRINAGGIVGTEDMGDFSKIISGTATEAFSVTVGKAYNAGISATAGVGGIAGYVSNGSVLGYAVAYSDITLDISSPTQIRHYLGGIAGQVYFSKLNAVASSGTYVNNSFGEFTHSAAGGYVVDYYGYTGGIAGRLYGASSLSDAVSLIDGVYQPIAGEALGGYEVVSPDDGQSIAAWLQANGYPADTVYEEISGDDDDELTYLVSHRFTVSDANYLVAAVDSRTDSDLTAVSNGIGTLSDEATLLSALNEIAAAAQA